MIKMRNIFKKKKKEQKPTTREEYAQVFGTLTQLEKSNLLYYNRKERRLFIEQPIARMMMQTEQGWLAFLQNCFLWISYREYDEAWNTFIIKEELAAVRRARRRFANMTANDIARIKRARRAELRMGDMEPPQIDNFEFFVVREEAPHDSDNTPTDNNKAVPGGEILLAGVYDADKDNWKASPWADIQAFMK